jgi:hypothetical protein
MYCRIIQPPPTEEEEAKKPPIDDDDDDDGDEKRRRHDDPHKHKPRNYGVTYRGAARLLGELMAPCLT